MTVIALGLFCVMLLAALLARRDASRLPDVPRWDIVARRGPPADFSCGHRTRRNAAFIRGGSGGDILIRKIPRWMAREVACPDCVLALLAEKSREEAVGFERLVPVQDLLDARQKNRPD